MGVLSGQKMSFDLFSSILSRYIKEIKPLDNDRENLLFCTEKRSRVDNI